MHQMSFVRLIALTIIPSIQFSPHARADQLATARLAYEYGQCEVAEELLQPLARQGNLEARKLLDSFELTDVHCLRLYIVPPTVPDGDPKTADEPIDPDTPQ